MPNPELSASGALNALVDRLIAGIPLTAGTAAIGTVTLAGGSTVVLAAGANSIGTVGLNAGANQIGTVGLVAGAASIGTVGLNAGAASIGTVGLNVGTNTIGRVMVAGADPTVAGAIATAPAAAALIATTGALAAGSYRIEVALGFSGVAAAGKHIMLEHRNAADAATLFTLALCPAGATQTYVAERVVVAANERLRIIVGAVAGAAGEVAQGSIRAQLLPS